MKKINATYILIILVFFIIHCNSNKPKITATSPNKNIKVTFLLSASGQAEYMVKYGRQTVIDTSFLGFDFQNQTSMNDDWKIVSNTVTSVKDDWEMPWGEKRNVINHYNELYVALQEVNLPNRKLNIKFRIYNDGIGFRYEFPEQDSLTEAIITNENTQFNLTGNHLCWWTPGDWETYEHLYNTTKFSDINALTKQNHNNLSQTTIPENAVNTPITMKTDNGLYLSFHEADLTDYAGMTLKITENDYKMQSELVGSDRTGYKVKRQLPFSTPWRTIQITERAGDLIESDLIVNLNEPNKIGDMSWFKPTKYVGIWWDMYLGLASWDMKSGNHGATTKYAKKLIDFASKNNIKSLLVEGWNKGKQQTTNFDEQINSFDLVTPYPDYNLNEVVAYGKDKGVDIIIHHQVSTTPDDYEKQLDTAFSLMKSLDIHLLKNVYFDKIMPKGEYNHGQYMVNHFRKVLEKAAKYQIAINTHEPIKPTGIRRTYPNAVTREGLRSQQCNAWASDGGNPPEHLPIVAFTRMLAGPVDYTPGIFNLKLKPYIKNNQVNTTLAHQLALYVVIYSPLQMAADLIDNYNNQPAFQFIQDVPANWEQTKVLNGEIGDYVTIARQERNSENWFIGSISDETPRTFEFKLDFLKPDKKYTAITYSDDKTAHWNDNPTACNITKTVVDSNSSLTLKLKSGGGAAVSLIVKN